MAQYVTGGSRFDSTDNNPGPKTSEREDLANFISMITRDETPFLSSIGKSKATAVYHEWQTDELRAPTDNATAEGAAISVGAVGDSEYRTRIGNYTQIFAEELEVSGTKRAVDQAGVADEYAYQLKKKGTELRRDVEFALVQSWNEKASGSTRTMGGVQSWASQSNVVDATANSGAGGIVADLAAGDTTFETVFKASGDGDFSAALADGLVEVDIELTQIDLVMQAIYEQGGSANTIMLSPKNRRALSAKANASGVNTVRNIDTTGQLRQSVDMYMSDFGDITVVPNYVMGLSATRTNLGNNNANDFCAIVYSPEYFAMASLRPLQEVEVGQVGDSTRGLMLEEGTLECKNPKGFGLIVGIGA